MVVVRREDPRRGDPRAETRRGDPRAEGGEGADGAVLLDRVELGTSFLRRFLGLMGRASLAEGEGLYLPTSSIHMWFMRFPIDAVFVSAPDGQGVRGVVAVRPRLRPWLDLVLPVRGAQGVIELSAGSTERLGVKVGDELTFEPVA
jgi:hypothetical protein